MAIIAYTIYIKEKEMKKSRPVTIKLVGERDRSWFVYYADRVKNGKYLAAQFSADDGKYSKGTTYEEVVEYIKNRDDIFLIEE